MNLNDFLKNDPIFYNCFVCGDKRYCEFYFNKNIYRVCAKCLKTKKVKGFFND